MKIRMHQDIFYDGQLIPVGTVLSEGETSMSFQSCIERGWASEVDESEPAPNPIADKSSDVDPDEDPSDESDPAVDPVVDPVSEPAPAEPDPQPAKAKRSRK